MPLYIILVLRDVWISLSITPLKAESNGLLGLQLKNHGERILVANHFKLMEWVVTLFCQLMANLNLENSISSPFGLWVYELFQIQITE